MSGVLHTDSEKFSNTSSYVGEAGIETRKNLFDSSVITADLIDALAYARAKERDFYHLYTDANTYEEFLAEIRKIFKGAKRDGEHIRSLSNANLSKLIPEGWNQKNAGQILIKIDTTATGIELPLELLNSENVSVEPGTYVVNVTKKSVKQLKEFFIAAIGKAGNVANRPNTEAIFRVGKSKKGLKEGKFDVRLPNWSNTSEDKKAFSKWILEEALVKEGKTYKNNFLSKIGIEFEITEGALTIEDLDEEAVPFTQYTLTSAREALKDPETKALLKRVLAQIRNYILNDCLQVSDGFVYDNGRGNILEKAAYSAWASVEREILTGVAAHFFEGLNLAKGILGANGEFQVKLINNYLAMVSGNNALANIIGGIVKDGRAEPRTDVQIISELGGDMGSVVAGIQVKNVNENTASHLGVSSDLELIAPNLPDGLRDTLANSMFNSDIRSMVSDVQELLENYLKTYFWKSLNLHVGDGLNPSHTNTFYFVGGTTLVPASIIISEMVGATGGSLEPDFTIGNLTNPEHGDKYFASRPGGDDSGEAPYFVDYWKAGRYIVRGAEDFSETAENESLYNKLLKGVSVNAEINMTGIISSYVNFSKGSMEIFPH